MPGSYEGVMFFLKPQWEELLNIKVWYSAVTQSFFSLSVGLGSLINYSSYNPLRHDIYRDALIISFTDTFTSILAGLTIFSVLGHLAWTSNVPIKNVITLTQMMLLYYYLFRLLIIIDPFLQLWFHNYSLNKYRK